MLYATQKKTSELIVMEVTMAFLIVVFIVELFVASAIYYFLRKLFFKKTFVMLAICTSLIGLIAGWVAGYRATEYDLTNAYLIKSNEQLQQERGISLSFEEENNLKKILFAKTEFTNLLHKRAAIHAVPVFLVVLIIMVRLSKKHEKQYMIGVKPVESATEDQVITNFSKTLPREKHSTIPLQKVVDEEHVYDEIAKELENGVADKGLWTRLFAECDGDERQTKVLYIKHRAQRLIAAKHADMEQPQNGHFVNTQKNDKLGVERAGLHNNKWDSDKSQTSTTPTHDQFSEELKRIERRTLAHIRAIYPSTFNHDSDKRS